MKLGVCADPKFGPALAEAGFDFLELHVQNHLKTLDDDATFAPELARIQSAALPCIAANCFVPGELKITGPTVDMDVLRQYAAVAFERAAQAGIQTIVFGSGGARRIPDGFDRDVAWQQLIDFGKLIGPIAQQNDVLVVVEPLNKKECNVLTSVGESGRYVEAVGHPNVCLLVDSYHWALDGDSYDDIVTYGPLLRHVHIATTSSRVPPGFEDCDFSAFFQALREANYDGPVSIEGRWEDIEVQAKEAFVRLERLVREEK
ncbi:MAG: sugar phosphate isomerase/epimerase [Anaerolineae bacterium]|nr:sugar phosphate isomerase/epimerase [Anaerolineae bacterium]